MQVNYRNRQIEKICTNASDATKKYGNRTAVLFINASTRSEPLIPLRCSSSMGSGDAISLLVTVKGNLQWTWYILCDWYLKSLGMRFR